MERRDFLARSGLGAAGGFLAALKPDAARALSDLLSSPFTPDASSATPVAALPAVEDAYWQGLRRYYVPPSTYVDLDNANTSPTAIPVFDAQVKRARELSHAPAAGFGKMWDEDLDKRARPALATLLGTRPANIAFMGNATMGLNTVLHGFPLKSGDEILVTDHEYPDMIETVLQRAKRDGIVMRVIRLQGLVEERGAFMSRLSASITLRTKLMLVSHISAWSGEVLPVADIAALAKSRGVAVLVDAAQSVGLLDVNFDAIGCDFLATSLHKWLGAPIATGALLMRPEQVGHVWPLHPPSWDTTEHPMDLYEWAGTFNVAACAAVADAIEFQRAIGAPRKRARLRLLGDYWQNKLRSVSRVRLLTPTNVDRSTGVGAFAIDGIPSADVAKHLRLRKKVLVQDKSGRHSPFANAMRVSPGPCTSLAELDVFVAAVVEVAKQGLPAPK